MRVKGIDHLNLSVESLGETVEWYGRVFGFELVESGVGPGRDGGPGRPWGILRGGDALLCVYERPGRVVADGDDLDATNRHGLRHFGLRISDVAAWEATLEREELDLRWGGRTRYPHSTSWYVADPTGHEIEVAAWDGDRVAFD